MNYAHASDYLATQSGDGKAATRNYAKAQRMPNRDSDHGVQPVEPNLDPDDKEQSEITRKTFTY